MRLLQILALWTAVSVPVSVATGFVLARRQGEPRPIPVRTAPAPRRASVTTA